MPTMEAACGFIIMARISSPRRLDCIHLQHGDKHQDGGQHIADFVGGKNMPDSEIFQSPKISGKRLCARAEPPEQALCADAG